MGHEVITDQIEKQAALAKGTARTLQQLNAKASALEALVYMHRCQTAPVGRHTNAPKQATAATIWRQGRDARKPWSIA
jgi:hypothetical protein